MSFFKRIVTMAKEYPGQLALVVVVSVVFLGGTIVGLYNKVRAKVPQLPAAK
jgi:hypothetical protein